MDICIPQYAVQIFLYVEREEDVDGIEYWSREKGIDFKRLIRTRCELNALHFAHLVAAEPFESVSLDDVGDHPFYLLTVTSEIDHIFGHVWVLFRREDRWHVADSYAGKRELTIRECDLHEHLGMLRALNKDATVYPAMFGDCEGVPNDFELTVWASNGFDLGAVRSRLVALGEAALAKLATYRGQSDDVVLPLCPRERDEPVERAKEKIATFLKGCREPDPVTHKNCLSTSSSSPSPSLG